MERPIEKHRFVVRETTEKRIRYYSNLKGFVDFYYDGGIDTYLYKKNIIC